MNKFNSIIDKMIKSNSPNIHHLSFEATSLASSNISRFQLLQQKQKSLWQTIRQNTSEAKKQFKKINQQLKDELTNKLQIKSQIVEEIVQTLDSKIQFVIQSCQKYGKRIVEHMMNKEDKIENERNSEYNQRFELINDRIRELEQKLFDFEQNEKALKSSLQVLKNENELLSQNYKVLAMKTNQKISQLENQLKLKSQALKQKIDQLKRKQNCETTRFTFLNSCTQQTPAVQTQPSFIQYQHLNNFRQKISIPNFVQRESNTSETNFQPQHKYSFDNNQVQIQPDFFRQNKQFKSIRQQNLMSLRKYQHQSNISLEHNHRFDYLMNNLVGSQTNNSHSQFVQQRKIYGKIGPNHSFSHR